MMDTYQRLVDCFAAVFPDLPLSAIPTASTVDVPQWDSIANVTLISVVEEEFSVQLPVDELENMTSFGLIERAIQGQLDR